MLARMRSPRLVAAALLLVLAVATVVISGCSAGQRLGQSTVSSTITSGSPVASSLTVGQAAFAADWRKAWTQQALWTRMAILGVAENPASTPFALTRLARTSSDMSALLAPSYGTAKAQAFGDLMTTHLDTTIAVVRAIKAGDAAGEASAEKSWYANAAGISLLLAETNPSIDQTATNNAFKAYLVVTKQQAVDRLASQYSADVGDFDAVEGQALRLSDMLSTAIIKQFPDKVQ